MFCRAFGNGNIGLEHVRKSVIRSLVALVESEPRTFAGGAGNGDWGTVHVHLPVANLVEPGPSKYGFASG